MVPDDYDNFPIDIDKAIEIGSEKDSGCGKLVKFLIDELILMGFEFELGLPEMKQDDMKNRQVNSQSPNEKGKKGFRFFVKWFYTISIKGSELGTHIKLQEFEFVLPFQGFQATLLGVARYLWQAVTSDENLEEIGKKLLDPEMLGKLILVIGAKKLLPELIDKLVCRQPKGEGGKELKDRANDDHKRDTDKEKDDAKDRQKDMENNKDNADGKNSGGQGGSPGGKYPDHQPVDLLSWKLLWHCSISLAFFELFNTTVTCMMEPVLFTSRSRHLRSDPWREDLIFSHYSGLHGAFMLYTC